MVHESSRGRQTKFEKYKNKKGNKEIEYKDWVVAREGNVIFLDDINNKFNFAIKFTLNYQDNKGKKEILNQYFN